MPSQEPNASPSEMPIQSPTSGVRAIQSPTSGVVAKGLLVYFFPFVIGISFFN